MSEHHEPLSLGEYLTVSEAAKLLGVSPETLRNWDRAGKLKPHRHPLNGYRLYKREDLNSLLHQAFSRSSKQSGQEAS